MALGAPGDVVEDRRAAALDPAVVAVGGDGAVVRRRLGVVEQPPDILGQRRLVGLEREHVVTALRDDRRRRALLAVHGIGSDDAAVERQQGEQFGQRHDLVGAVDPPLAEHQALLAGPGADQVQRRPAVLAVERAPRGLAVDRDHALDLRGQRAQRAREAGPLLQ
jgi:hypothetical protein